MMCGIVGFVDFYKKTNKDTLEAMINTLYHRGPDASGYSFHSTEFANIALGHRRLSILDLSEAGNQPMKFEHLEIVYNGEVYNFKEIKKELETYGYRFFSNTDTEVILKAFHKWGIEAIHKFIGMFAIAIYDRKEQQLILIRDRMGVKPLYYYYKDGLFLFASELKSFHKHPNFKKNINIDALALFFRFGYIIQPYSIFQNTWKLRAGYYGILDLKKGGFKEIKYWDVIDYYNKPKLKIDFQEAVEETESLLKSSVRYRMVSDVPVGLFLSGGYDSSTVAAILQNEIGGKIKTFTIGFFEKEFNEANYAKQIAKYLETEHVEYYCSQRDVLEILPIIPRVYDEPFGDNSLIPTILVSKIARQDVKVALSADGGDEIFGGYTKYIRAYSYFSIISKLPLSLRSAFIRLLDYSQLESKKFFLKLKGIKHLHKLKEIVSSKNIIDVENAIVSFFSKKEIEQLLYIEFEESSFYDAYLYIYDDIDKMMALDFKTYLPDDILVKVDRATMSVSLEGREPLLDHRLIEFMTQLPSNFKIKKGIPKLLLKEIAHKYIPKKLIDRPKMGFSSPILYWIKSNLTDIAFQAISSLEKVAFLNSRYIKQIFKLWNAGVEAFTKKIWILIIFYLWYYEWIQ